MSSPLQFRVEGAGGQGHSQTLAQGQEEEPETDIGGGVAEGSSILPGGKGKFMLKLDTKTRPEKGEGSAATVTPETCVASPTIHFPPPTRRVFSPCEILKDTDSGPHSSYFNLLDEIHSSSEGSKDLNKFLSSSSSSEDSDSESDSEKGRFDLDIESEDEEFAALVDKYYRNMDLSDSDSDLTQVSPMSSFTAEAEELTTFADHRSDHSPNAFGHGRLLSFPLPLPRDKPLPPLVIHTLEDISIPIVKACPAALAKGFQVPAQAPSSLLMKVEDAEEKGNEADTESLQGKEEKVGENEEKGGGNGIRNGGRKLSPNKGQLRDIKGTIHHHRFNYHHQPVKASAAIARQRQQRRIEHDNMILVRRLKSVKPSKEIVEAFRNNLKCTF